MATVGVKGLSEKSECCRTEVSDVLTGQTVMLLMMSLAVLYHFCMRDEAKLLKIVKEPVKRKVQAVRHWFQNKAVSIRHDVRTPTL